MINTIINLLLYCDLNSERNSIFRIEIVKLVFYV